ALEAHLDGKKAEDGRHEQRRGDDPARMPDQPGCEAIHERQHYTQAPGPIANASSLGHRTRYIASCPVSRSCCPPVTQPARRLPAALASLRRQTWSDWECIVVDDGSRDRTREVAVAVAAEDRRVTVVPTSPRGLVAALGAGLARCRGEYVARLDADDLMRRDRLAAQVAALDRTPGLAAVGSHVRFFPRAGLSDGLRAHERWLNSLHSPAPLL